MGAAGLRHTSEGGGMAGDITLCLFCSIVWCVVCAEIPRVTFTAKAVHASGLSSSAL